MVNKIKVIFLLFRRTSFLNKKKLFQYLITSIIIYSILFSFCALLPAYEYNKIAPFKYAGYDLILNSSNRQSEKELDELSEIDRYVSIVTFSSIEFNTNGRNIKMDVDFLFGDLEDITLTSYSNKLLIKSKKDIFNNENLNPIVLDVYAAKQLMVDVGDNIYIVFGPNREKIEFKVVALYEPVRPNSGVVALWKGKQKDIYEKEFGILDEYSKTFIKGKNINRLKEQLNDLGNRSKGQSIIDRESELNFINLDLEFTPPIIMLTSILGFFVLLIYYLREENKKLIILNKNFAILYSLGCRKFELAFYFVLEMLIMQIPTYIMGVFISKYIIYDRLILSIYLSKYLLYRFLIYGIGLQISAMFISILIIYYKLKKQNISLMLVKE